MRALLLAAGFGTRLRPLTDTIPKCLVPINGRPLLDIWLQNLDDAGIESFLVNTHYLSEQVETYLNGSRFKDKVTLVHEPVLLGTGGTLRANHNFFKNSDGLLIHADNYCITDFNAFVNCHLIRPDKCLMTLMSFRTENPQSCGILKTDENNIVTGFYEKVPNPPGNLANGAVYCLSTEIMDWMIENKVSDISTEVLPNFMGRIANFENKYIHIDIGSPAEYERAQNILSY